MQSQLQTPNISGILATDTFKFDFQHIDGLSTTGIAAAGSIYFKVSISTNGGTSFTQIDSVAATGVALGFQKLILWLLLTLVLLN